MGEPGLGYAPGPLSVVDTRRSPDSRSRYARSGRRRHWGLLVFLILALIAGGLTVAAFKYIDHCKGAGSTHKPVTVTIPEGASGGDVVDILHEAGVLRCGGMVEKFLMQGNPRADHIRAGTHHLTTNMTLDQALAVLSRKPPVMEKVDVTIPEGFRLTQIADRVQEDLGIPAKQFLKTANSGTYSLPPYLPDGKESPEGFLYPLTYPIPVKTATADSVIQVLLDQFGTEVADLPWKSARKLGVTPYEVVIVASMIEKETGVDRDRPLISAVIYNRLAAGMHLGIDATLLYDDPTPGDNTLTARDLESDSPYNTRKHTGVPPTPIASPQEASIAAALEPADAGFLYYVKCEKDGKGRSRFSKTNNKFLRDKAECLGT